MRRFLARFTRRRHRAATNAEVAAWLYAMRDEIGFHTGSDPENDPW